MRHYGIAISDIAERDLLNSYYYIYFELESPIAAEKFKSALHDKIGALSDVPMMGEVHSKFPAYRTVHVAGYRIFYMVDEENSTVMISRVFHAKQQDQLGT